MGIFAKTCFGVLCPLAPFADWPISEESLKEDMPSDSCERIRGAGCQEAFIKTEHDCAADELARKVWFGEVKGFCVRCQKLVEAYRRLQSRCPKREAWQSTLHDLLAEFAENDKPGTDAAPGG